MKNIALKAALITFAGSSFLSCTRDANDPGLEYAPDMYQSAAYEPLRELERNKFNVAEGGTNMRYPVAGTIARGKMGYSTHVSKDSVEVAAVKLQNPLPRTEKNLADGKVLYVRFCAPCHGAEGKGDGLVGQKYKGVANFQAGNVKNASQGHLFHVITHGKGRMYPHGSQVNPEERWKIAMYVATLQDPAAAAALTEPATPASVTTGQSVGTSTDNTNQVTGESTDPTNETDN